MLESKLEKIATEVFGEGFAQLNEEEKKKFPEKLHETERELDDKIHSLLRDAREDLEEINRYSSYHKLSSTDKDDIIRKVLKSLTDTYNGV